MTTSTPFESAAIDAARRGVRISVALASYNGAGYLRAQLASLEAQTVQPDEIVVCDDRSTDHTLEIVRAYAADSRVPVRLVVNDERLGWRGNFVKAAGLCRHELIAFCDQDDVWYPQKLQTVVREFADPAVMLVHHNADLVDSDGRAYDTLAPTSTERRIIEPLSRPTHWSNPLGLTMVFRASLARYNDLWVNSVDLAVPGQRAAHDQWFYFLATNVGKIVSLPDCLLGYRQHRANAVGWGVQHTSKRGIADQAAILAEVDRMLHMLRPFCEALRLAAARGGDLAPRFAEAFRKNRALAERLERRRRLYEERTLAGRVRSIFALLAKSDYSQRGDWGLGTRAFIADLVRGVAGRRADAR